MMKATLEIVYLEADVVTASPCGNTYTPILGGTCENTEYDID